TGNPIRGRGALNRLTNFNHVLLLTKELCIWFNCWWYERVIHDFSQVTYGLSKQLADRKIGEKSKQYFPSITLRVFGHQAKFGLTDMTSNGGKCCWSSSF